MVRDSPLCPETTIPSGRGLQTRRARTLWPWPRASSTSSRGTPAATATSACLWRRCGGGRGGGATDTNPPRRRGGGDGGAPISRRRRGRGLTPWGRKFPFSRGHHGGPVRQGKEGRAPPESPGYLGPLEEEPGATRPIYVRANEDP